MTHRQLKASYFFLEAVTAYGTAYYFNYLFFFMKEQYGLTNLGNLAICSLNGLFYLFGSFYGGQYAQRFGFFHALKAGFAIMSVTLAIGSQFPSPVGQSIMIFFWTGGMCLIWPSVQALVCEGENRAGLQRMVGIYNLMWSGGSALAYFTGGTLLNTLGMQSLFWLPVTLHTLQLLLVLFLQRAARHLAARTDRSPPGEETHPLPRNLSLSPESFLRIAWIANPFAYVAINTVVAVMPDLATRFHLSLAMAGFFCSIWYFVRVGAFVLLWQWDGWHYRFRWLLGAYFAVILSFLGMLLLPTVALVIAAQILFGFAVCLIYYSSLFYAMDVGETKGEHGGFHEAAIGAGICAGPATGAATLYLLPQYTSASVWSVSGLLVIGAIAILAARAKARARTRSQNPLASILPGG